MPGPLGAARGYVRWCAIALVGVIASSCAGRRPQDLASTIADKRLVLGLITWNVNAGRGDLPQLVEDLVTGRLAGVPIRDYVILLQETVEGSEYDAAAFGRARGLTTIFEPVRESSRGTSGNAILTTETVLSSHVIVLPRERRVRKAVAAIIEVDGARLVAVCTHLENRTSWLRGGLFSDNARARQARALVQALPKGPGVVGGDFNTWLGPNEPAWQALRARFDDTPSTPLEATFRDRLVLDALFFDLPEGWAATQQVVQNRYGSDHHPVLGVIYDMGPASRVTRRIPG